MSCIKQLLDTKKRKPPLSDSHSEAVRTPLICLNYSPTQLRIVQFGLYNITIRCTA